MSLFDWSENYRIGFAHIDAQHRRLFGLAAKVEAAVEEGTGRVIESAVQQLMEYTRTHFAMEEKLMRTHHYPGLRSHRAEHSALAAQVLRMSRELPGGGAEEHRLPQLLKVWLAHHIAFSDRRIGTWVRARESPPVSCRVQCGR